MDWLSFIAAMVKALAWPITVLFALSILRKPLIELIPTLEWFKWGDRELRFSKKIKQLQQETPEMEITLANERQEAVPEIQPPDRIQALLRVSPTSAIIDAWRELEAAAAACLARNVPNAPKPMSIGQTWTSGQLGDILHKHNLLNSDQLNLYHELRRLRNAATHSPEFAIDEESAQGFIELSNRLSTYLDSK